MPPRKKLKTDRSAVVAKKSNEIIHHPPVGSCLVEGLLSQPTLKYLFPRELIHIIVQYSFIPAQEFLPLPGPNEEWSDEKTNKPKRTRNGGGGIVSKVTYNPGDYPRTHRFAIGRFRLSYGPSMYNIRIETAGSWVVGLCRADTTLSLEVKDVYNLISSDPLMDSKSFEQHMKTITSATFTLTDLICEVHSNEISQQKPIVITMMCNVDRNNKRKTVNFKLNEKLLASKSRRNLGDFVPYVWLEGYGSATFEAYE